MGVVSIHPFPIPEGKSGPQAAEMLQKRLETIGAVMTGTFHVELETYHPAPHITGSFVDPNRLMHVMHCSDHPATTFTLLDNGVCLVADPQMDMLLLKMTGIYIPKKAIRIEAKGPRYKLNDFILKIGSVSIGPSFRGILVEVEYLPCVIPLSCWDLMRELLQGLMGGGGLHSPSQYLQGKMNQLYTPVDTVHQYLEHFSGFRRAPQPR